LLIVDCSLFEKENGRRLRDMMKKQGLFMVCVFVVLVMAGCPDLFNDTGDSPPGQDDQGGQNNPGGAAYAEECWGEWIRIDADETWYISGGAIKVNGAAHSAPVSLAKQSDRVIQVTEGGLKYYLFASRIANTRFTGKTAGGKEGGKVVVENLDSGGATEIQTDSDGGFAVEGAIPGDTYQIKPEGGTPVTVKPQGDGDDVGTITVTDGANLKTSIRASRNSGGYIINEASTQNVLYAGTQYDFTMSITNVGTEDCHAATYRLSFEDGLTTSASPAETTIGTIEPGELKSKTIALSLRCDPINEEYVYKKITIAITDQRSLKTWEDSVSVRFYRGAIAFNLKAARRIPGVIITPGNQAYRFSGTNTSVSAPWAPGDYLVVFSGISADEETAYSFAVYQRPESDFSGFTELTNYEPNDTEQTAAELPEPRVISYLDKNDIDCYRFRVSDPGGVPPYLSFDESLVWLREYAVEGGAYTITLHGDETIAPETLSYSGKNVAITLDGGTAERTMSLLSNGPLFTVESGVTLELGNNITLQGRSGNYAALVRVESGGTLEMNSGSKIRGNTTSASYSSSYGGGVYVGSGAFIMNGGEISGNTAFASSSSYYYSSSYGGGVYVGSGTFTKGVGGIIYGSDADSTLKNTASGYSYSHAVYVSADKKRRSTVGESETLDSTQSGAAGGWVAEPMPGNLSLNESLVWLSKYATEGGVCTITLNENETIAPRSLSYDGKHITITLSGGAAERTVDLSSNGSLFTVGSGVTLELGNNITLQGRSSNNAALVRVESGGTLEMSSGSKICGNTSSSSYYSSYGGGVHVGSGTFIMNGGTISGNSSSYGGGVYVDWGTFTMSGGTISGNTANTGGGVYVDSGTFTMSGGEVSGNTVSSSAGGGVCVDSGTFTMSGGEVSGNTAYSPGGGVYVAYGGTLAMTDGTISGNTSSRGGGVFADSGSTFTMSGGTISGNSSNSGGGVSVDRGTFTKMSGGVTFGSDASDTLKNTATSDNGHAVYVYVFSGSKKRNSTAGEGVTLDSTKSGSAGGWE
jgi:hypothetical protein